MPRDMVKFTIAGDTYSIGYMATSQAIKVATEVASRLLPPLGKVLPKSGSISDILKTDMSNLDMAGAFESLASRLDPDKMVELLQKLCSVVILDGQGLLDTNLFEEHFKGQIGVALKVAKKSFEVNCGDFFASAVSLSGLAKKAASTPAPTPSTGS